MRRISVTVMFIATISTAACARDESYPKQDCNKATNQLDLNQCAQANFESADRALNDAYRRTMDAQGDQAAKEHLRDSERAWISFRDRECARQVGPREDGGSIWPMDLASCLEDKTAARIHALNRCLDWLNGTCAK